MRQIFNKGKALVFSRTAQNTLTLFVGNTADAFLAFVFTVIAFRALDTENFGIYSALNNFLILLYSLLDVGFGAGVIRFVSFNIKQDKPNIAYQYQKAAFILRGSISLIIAVVVIIFSYWLGPKLFLISNPLPVALTGAAIFFMSLVDLIIVSLQAHLRFFQSALASIIYSLSRVILILLVSSIIGLNSVVIVMAITSLASLMSAIIGFRLLGLNFLKRPASLEISKTLLSFSGWIGVSRIASSISGRVDTQLAILLLGAYTTGVYSVSARIATFYSVVVTSFGAVLAPKFSSNQSLDELKPLIKKSLLAIIGLIVLMFFGISIARPFILTLFGQKAAESVAPFQGLTLAFMPFVASSLATVIIIYNLHKPSMVGLLSVAQLVVIILGNLFFIPKYGIFGPVVTLAISNSIIFIVSYVYVIKKWKSIDKK